MQRDCIDLRKQLFSSATWLRTLSVLFLLYFCYKELLPRTSEISTPLVTTLQESEGKNEVNLTALETRISQIEKRAKTVQNSIEAELSKLKTKITNQDRYGAFDSSSVAATVLESTIRSAKPKLLPCDWLRCRTSNFQDNVNKLIVEYLSKLERSEKISIVQVGFCIPSIMNNITKVVANAISRFEVLDEFRMGSSSANATCRSFGLQNELKLEELYRTVNTWAQNLSNSTSTHVEVVRERDRPFPDKSLDIVIIDHTNEFADRALENAIKKWMKRLKVGGIMIGHSMAVLRPFEEDKGVDVSWNRNAISPGEIMATKNAIYKFLYEDMADLNALVAGDTTWYIQKKKLRLSNLFKP